MKTSIVNKIFPRASCEGIDFSYNFKFSDTLITVITFSQNMNRTKWNNYRDIYFAFSYYRHLCVGVCKRKVPIEFQSHLLTLRKEFYLGISHLNEIFFKRFFRFSISIFVAHVTFFSNFISNEWLNWRSYFQFKYNFWSVVRSQNVVSWYGERMGDYCFMAKLSIIKGFVEYFVEYINDVNLGIHLHLRWW